MKTARYWLFKTEPDCFGIDHLAALPRQTSSWDGVRNYQSRNFLRDDVKIGDGVFFYHSSCKPTGIAGICEVVRAGYPDTTACDPDGEHFDPKSSESNPIWYTVDVQLKVKFPEVLTLTALKAEQKLAGMMVTQQGSRLSIQPVRPEEWIHIMSMTGMLGTFSELPRL